MAPDNGRAESVQNQDGFEKSRPGGILDGMGIVISSIRVLAAAVLATFLALSGLVAAPMQSDCRRPGSIGTALMGEDGTITLNLRSPSGEMSVLAYKKGDPNYARIVSHIGGIQPGERKPVPPFC